MTTPAKMNKDRADRVRQALAAAYDCNDAGNTDNLVDLLTDIRHLCDELEVNYYDLTETAYRHYLEEREEAQKLRV